MNRVHSFPVPALGETIPSVVSRHLARQAGGKQKHLESLGIVRGTAPHARVMVGVHTLAKLVPEGHPWYDDPHKIIRDNTVTPLYIAFSSEEERIRVVQSIADGTASSPSKLLGASATGELRHSKTYKFCRKCVLSDWQNGFAISYCHHQPPFVRVCALHEEPLISGCNACFTHVAAAGRWNMAGECSCSKAFFSFDSCGMNARDFDGWLWLAQQTYSILKIDSRPKAAPAEILRGHLGRKFGSNGGLSVVQIVEAATELFSAEILQYLEITGRDSSRNSTYWIRSAFQKSSGSDVLTGQGNFARLLILLRLVTDDVLNLFLETHFPADESSKSRSRAEVVYSISKLRKSPEDRELLKFALEENSYKISPASRSLGLATPGNLVSLLLANAIRVPLSKRQVSEIGQEKIVLIQSSLTAGDSNKFVMSKFAVPSWTLTLIKLDNPSLHSLQRQAAFQRQRAKHRAEVEEFLRLHTNATRTTIKKTLSATTDWLSKRDLEWYKNSLPPPSPLRGVGGRKTRKDWPSIDARAVQHLKGVVADQETALGRPLRRSATFLRKAIKIPPNSMKRLPLLKAALLELAESRSTYLERRIRWALNEYLNLDVPLSMDRLRMLGSISPVDLRSMADFIETEAIALGLVIDARTFGVKSGTVFTG